MSRRIHCLSLLWFSRWLLTFTWRPKWARNCSPGLGWSWYVTLCHGGHLGYQIRLPLAIQNLLLFEEFQDCLHGRHLGYWNWTKQQFWISMSPLCISLSFASTWVNVWEEMWFEEFQDGGHLGHWNRWTLAILNFHNTPMPPIMFKLNQTYRSVADVIWRFSRWQPYGHLKYQNGTILAILNLHDAPMPSIGSLNPTYCSGADNNWRLPRWPRGMLF